MVWDKKKIDSPQAPQTSSAENFQIGQKLVMKEILSAFQLNCKSVFYFSLLLGPK